MGRRRQAKARRRFDEDIIVANRMCRAGSIEDQLRRDQAVLRAIEDRARERDEPTFIYAAPNDPARLRAWRDHSIGAWKHGPVEGRYL